MSDVFLAVCTLGGVVVGWLLVELARWALDVRRERRDAEYLWAALGETEQPAAVDLFDGVNTWADGTVNVPAIPDGFTGHPAVALIAAVIARDEGCMDWRKYDLAEEIVAVLELAGVEIREGGR